MPHFHRWFVPGATYFFTQVTDRRLPFLCTEVARPLLRQVLQECQQRWPFTIDAIVLLPDHFHTIWTLPPDDKGYPKRWGWMKKEFTKAWVQQGNPENVVSHGRQRERRRGVWHPRFWEHVIRDEDDCEKHFDYVHYNPVKHGLVRSPRDWPWSSFHRWVKAGVYPENWASDDAQAPDFRSIEDLVGE